jgi:hypothetical protein
MIVDTNDEMYFDMCSRSFGGRSVGIVCSWTKGHGVCLFVCLFVCSRSFSA